MAVSKTVGRLLIRLGFDARDAKKKTKNFENHWQKTVQSISAASKKLAVGIAAAGTAITGLGVSSVQASVDFNRGFRNVGTLLTSLPTDVAQDRMYELRQEVLRLQKETGQTSESLNKGVFDVISAGFGDMSEGIGSTVEILELVNKGAIAGGATVSESLSLASAVTKAWGDQSAEATEKVLDLAFKTNELGQTTFPELARNIGEVTGATQNLGISQEELFGVYATLTGVTGNAMKVTTQYQAILTGLQKPTKEMSVLFEELGVKTGKEFLETTGGLAGALEAVADHVGSTDAQMTDMFSSVEALKAVLPLTGAQAEVLTEKIDAMRESGGSMEKGFDSMKEGVGRVVWEWDRFKAAIEVARIEIGNALEEPVADTLEGWTDWINDNSTAWGEWARNAVYWTKDVLVPQIQKGWEAIAKRFEQVKNTVLEEGWPGFKKEMVKLAVEIGTEVGKSFVGGFLAELATIPKKAKESVGLLGAVFDAGRTLMSLGDLGIGKAIEDELNKKADRKARGGIVKGPTLIGEAGPEAIVPLGRGEAWAMTFLADLLGVQRMAGGGMTGSLSGMSDREKAEVMAAQQMAEMNRLFQRLLQQAQAPMTGAYKVGESGGNDVFMPEQYRSGERRLSGDALAQQLQVEKMLNEGQFLNFEAMDLENVFGNLPADFVQKKITDWLDQNLNRFVTPEGQGFTNKTAMKALFNDLLMASSQQMGASMSDLQRARMGLGRDERNRAGELEMLTDRQFLKKYGASVEAAEFETDRLSSQTLDLAETYAIQKETAVAGIASTTRLGAMLDAAAESTGTLAQAQMALAGATLQKAEDQNRPGGVGLTDLNPFQALARAVGGAIQQGDAGGSALATIGGGNIILEVDGEQIARVNRANALRDSERNTFSDL